jgi:ADP-ribosylglycohydrolase
MTDGFGDAVYGCLIGGAVGDALGAPVEGWTHERIEEEYGTFEEFKQYYMPYSKTDPGTITSDTALRHYLCLAVVESDGRVYPPQFAEVLRQHLNPNRVWINEEIVVKKISAGLNPWDIGRGAVPDNKATGAITPIGIVNAGDPEQAYHDGVTIASMMQEGPHRHASATVAAGIAEAVTPEATIESVIDTMMEQSSGIVTRGIDIALGIAEASQSVDELTETLYERFLDWRWPAVQWDREKYYAGELFSASPMETLPVAVAILSVHGDSANRSIIEGVNYGRDSDAIATVTGSIAGALHGASEIRDGWKTQCEESNRDFFEELEGDPDADFEDMAERLVGALETERETAAARRDRLGQLLDATE